MEGRSITRRLLAEAVGTFVLVFFAVRSAVFGSDKIGDLGVALAFGFVLLALAYSVGPISGCHVKTRRHARRAAAAGHRPARGSGLHRGLAGA